MLKFLYWYFIINFGLIFLFVILNAKFIFKWYDLWIGFYYDKGNWVVYYFPIPMFGFRLELFKWFPFNQEIDKIIKHKYRVGDKVRIKDDLEVNKKYSNNIECIPAMITFCSGKEDIIKYQETEGIYKGAYRLEIQPFFWSEEMIELVEEV